MRIPNLAPDDVILSPLGKPGDQPTYALAQRLNGIAGRRIGLLDNSKQNATSFLDEVASLLRDLGARDVVYRLKVSAAVSAGDTLHELASSCDAVVNAYGDCGSCTSWCVHDSVDLERLGVPVATINTNEFVTLGRFEAASLGIPNLPIVVIPHPIGSLPANRVREHARVAFDDILEVLTRQSDELAPAYVRAIVASGGQSPPLPSTMTDAPSCGCDG